MTFDEILTRFDVDKRRSGSAQCKCPAHSDKQASLTISHKGSKTLLHCHAGCGTDDILSRVGLQIKDLFDEDQPTVNKWRAYIENREQRKIEAVYNYQTLSGEYAFTKIRMTGKKIIYGILENDRFTYGLKGKSRRDIPALYSKDINTIKAAAENGERIFYAEGEKDIDNLVKRGFKAITAGGSGDWQSVFSDVFAGAEVVILADNDQPGMKLAYQVRSDIESKTKSTKIVIPTPEIEKGDISDYLENHSVEDFEKLLNEASEEIEINEISEFSENNEIIEISEENLDRFHLCNKNGDVTGVYDFEIFSYLKERENIFVLGGIPYIYTHGVFIADETGSRLKTMIRELIYPQFVKSTTIKRIYELFISAAELETKFDDVNKYPSEWINFLNGFYDPRNKKIIPHDPQYKAINQIPHDYQPDKEISGSEIEKWLGFIIEKEDDREMLLQYAGYCLTRDVSMQRFLVLNGEGGSGKSTVIRLIECMTGQDNVSNISLTELSQRFASYGLLSKLLNSCADLEISALEETSTLKKILGEDTLRAEKKGHDAISFKSYAKLIFSTNELPIVKAEKTNGFYRRLLILPMNKVPEKKDPNLFDRLSAEIDYFIKISVEALEKMYQRDSITVSESSEAAVRQLRADSDTVQAFIDSEISVVKGLKIERGRLYQLYDDYCSDTDRQSLTRNNFYKSMRLKGFEEQRLSMGRYFCDISLEKSVTESVTESVTDGFKPIDEYDQMSIPFK